MALDADLDFDTETDALEERHHLAVMARLWIADAFVVTASEPVIAALRCEPSVRRITQDRTVTAL